MIHQTIKNDIKESLRARDTIRLEVLRGLSALAQNELMSTGSADEFLPDDKMLALVKRSAKQHKDSIEQFEKGGRIDLVEKEKAELLILNTFLPTLMSRDEVQKYIEPKISSMKSTPGFDPKSAGKITGMMMKELAGKADGSDVKAVVEELLK